MRTYLFFSLLLLVATSTNVAAQTQPVTVEHCSQAGMEFFVPHSQDSLVALKNRLADPARVAAAAQLQTLLHKLTSDYLAGRIEARNPDSLAAVSKPDRFLKVALGWSGNRDTTVTGAARDAAVAQIIKEATNQVQVHGTYACNGGTCTFVPERIALVWYDPTGITPYHIRFASFRLADLDAAGYRIGNQTLSAYFASQNGTPGLSILLEFGNEPYMTMEDIFLQTARFSRRLPVTH